MTRDTSTEADLEQALLSVFAAAEQFGIDAEMLRLMAIGGLTNESPAPWVVPQHVPGAITVLNQAASVVTTSMAK